MAKAKEVNIRNLIAAISIILLFACGFCLGAAYSQDKLYPLIIEQSELATQYYNVLNMDREKLRVLENKAPEVITVKVPVEVLVEVVRKIPVEVVREVEVIKYRHIIARDWESVEQFTLWYEEQDILHSVMIPSNPDMRIDCDDYSERLQRVALQQGYPVSEALSKGKLYCGVVVNKISDRHAGNLVLIGNTFYWVEPQPNMFTIKKVCDKD